MRCVKNSEMFIFIFFFLRCHCFFAFKKILPDNILKALSPPPLQKKMNEYRKKRKKTKQNDFVIDGFDFIYLLSKLPTRGSE